MDKQNFDNLIDKWNALEIVADMNWITCNNLKESLYPLGDFFKQILLNVINPRSLIIVEQTEVKFICDTLVLSPTNSKKLSRLKCDWDKARVLKANCVVFLSGWIRPVYVSFLANIDTSICSLWKIVISVKRLFDYIPALPSMAHVI